MEMLKQEVKHKLAEESGKSGRRELALELADRGLKTFFHPDPKHPDKSLPVRRAQSKRPEGMSARQWKRQRMAGLRERKNVVSE